MKLKKILIVIIFTILSFSSNSLYSASSHQTAETVHKEVIEFIQTNEELYEQNKEQFIKNIDSIMDPVVDFRRIARNVMGKYYKQSSSAQREEFFQVFRSTLLTTYADTFVEFKDEKIKVLPPKTKPKKPNRSKVEVEIITATKVYPATYDMYLTKDGTWKIINIVVNGVNLGLTFRNQFYSLSEKRNANIDLVIQEWVAAL